MRKQWSVRGFSLLVAAALLMALAGCDGNETGVQVQEDPNTQPEYISFFSSQNFSNSSVAKYWSDQFMKQYNRQVYVDFDSALYYDEEGLSYRELLEKRLDSSSPDDMYIIKAEDVLAFGKKGYWMDLSSMNFVDNLSEAARYQSTYDGQVFSVPLSFTGFGLLWNVDLLQENGLSIPTNLEEFLHVCETLKHAGVLPYGANKGSALTVPAMCVGLSSLYGSEDLEERIAALNSGETSISGYLRDGFAFLSMMIEKGYLDPQQALASTPRKEDYALFHEGNCGFVLAGLGDIYNQDLPSFSFALTGLPVLAHGSVAVYGANSRLCVNPDSKHLSTVLEFIEMVGTPDALTQSAALEHTMSSAKDSHPDNHPGEEALVALLQRPGQIPNQDFALHFNTWESIRDVGREICAGATVDQACAMLDEKQRTDLQNYGA